MRFTDRRPYASSHLPSPLPYSGVSSLLAKCLYFWHWPCVTTQLSTTLPSSWYASSWPLTCFVLETPTTILWCGLWGDADDETLPEASGQRIEHHWGSPSHSLLCSTAGTRASTGKLITAEALASAWIISPNWTSWARMPTVLTLKVGHSEWVYAFKLMCFGQSVT